MATTQQYSDLFTYGEFIGIRDWCTVSYKNVTLMKDMCGKKVGAKLDEIHLDTRTGKFTVPRRHSTRTVETEAAKTLVEFKGKHTRFPDSDDESAELDSTLPLPSNPKAWRTNLEDKGTPLDKSVFEKGESSSRPNNISGMIGLKIYENKRKLLRVESRDDLIARKIDEHLRKEMRTVKSDITIGPRGDLTFTFQTSSMECIPAGGMFHEFIVIGCRYYYKRVV